MPEASTVPRLHSINLPSRCKQSDESEQGFDDVAEPLFAGGQLRRRLQAVRHVADGADDADRLALVVADDPAARNHPAIGAVAVLEPQFVAESVFSEIASVAIHRFGHADAVVGMNAPEERFRSWAIRHRDIRESLCSAARDSNRP